MGLLRVEESDESSETVQRPLIHDAQGTFLLNTDFPQQNGEDEDPYPESFFGTKPGLNVLLAIDPIADGGITSLATAGRPHPLMRAFSTSFTFTTFSTFSNASTLSVRSSGRTFFLKELCKQVVDKHLWLQTARIVSTTCYAERLYLWLLADRIGSDPDQNPRILRFEIKSVSGG
ncbi:uncharacterized protein EI90DRAFT_3082505 [Cantharellus anzutake]|uniref:uncharacterized protein n=1 Tax=Cantharellus anzutake TaxID=1750568 RepID=UPI001903F733|nr:uncharacterized protein EI90DRAFT_3082505 [Cantharellus anzutake]KAF8319186.1 hypothetical protein EI90DRAFT_3082505 [Cantharellus anzutake]